MSSNLKVNTILPSSGGTVAVSGILSATSNVSVAGVATFSEDTKFIGAISGRDLQWDKSDNALEFLDLSLIHISEPTRPY